MSTLVAVDGVLSDLEASSGAPAGVSPLVGEPSPDEERERRDPEPPEKGEPADGPP
jgi:hypothetical protein